MVWKVNTDPPTLTKVVQGTRKNPIALVSLRLFLGIYDLLFAEVAEICAWEASARY